MPARGGQPGARARPVARRGLAGRPRQGLHRAEPGRLRALGRAAARGVDRQARQGPGPGARRVAGRAGPAGAGGARSPGSTSSAQEFFRWEFATAVAGSILEINPFDQPDVQAAKDKTKEILASGDEPMSSRWARRTSSSRRRDPGDYVAILAFVDPTPRTRPSSPRSPIVLARRRAASSRTASAPATCTRPGSCTRAARPRGSSCRSWTTRATSSQSRSAVRFREADPGAGGRRLRLVAGARPPGRANPIGGR